MAPFYRYPANLGQPPFDKWIRFRAMSGRHVLRGIVPESTQPDSPVASVGLYLPPTALKSTQTLKYESGTLGVVGGVIAEQVSQGAQGVAEKYANVSGGIPGLLDGLKKTGKALLAGDFSGVTDQIAGAAFSKPGQTVTEFSKAVAQQFAQGVAKSLSDSIGDNTDVALAAATAFGSRINTRMETQFDSQQYRTHQIDFTLIPRSLAEAKAIDQIIYFFQFYSLPRYGEGDFMVGFPYEFTVDLMAAQADNSNASLNHMNRIGRSVITSVVVDHAGGSKTAFIKDNGDYYPVASTLTVHLQEVRLLARGDVEIKRANGNLDTINAYYDDASAEFRNETTTAAAITLPDTKK